MAATSYTNFESEIVYENRAGTEHDYVRDGLGSTVALLDNTQTQTDTFVYWPYGETRTSTGSTSTPFQFVGVSGCHNTGSTSLVYMRGRHYVSVIGQWLTVDPIWPAQPPYSYALNSPTYVVDPFGLYPCSSCWWICLVGLAGCAACLLFCDHGGGGKGGPPKPPAPCAKIKDCNDMCTWLRQWKEGDWDKESSFKDACVDCCTKTMPVVEAGEKCKEYCDSFKQTDSLWCSCPSGPKPAPNPIPRKGS